MTSKEWRHHIRSLAPVSRPDDVETALLKDFAATERLLNESRALGRELAVDLKQYGQFKHPATLALLARAREVGWLVDGSAPSA